VRWVDDVAIFASDARTRTEALLALRRSWASFGLEIHDGKTVCSTIRSPETCVLGPPRMRTRVPALR
jgi:hypothetical protein